MKFFVSLKTLAQNKFENKESAKTTSEKKFTKKRTRNKTKALQRDFVILLCFFWNI